ncbi:MAG: acyltransferase [Polaromonas sp.]|nr:acyltransferase [Polaromonas sp.]
MIGNLQLLRGLAALAVVFYHTNYRFAGGVHSDFQGVAVFFVISGFIMTFISRANADFFMVRRIIRVAPIYWVATLAFFFIEICAFSTDHAVAWWNYQSNAKHLVKSLLFVPYQNGNGAMQPLLPVGWTLNLEIFYYFLFFVALKISHRFAPLITFGALFVLWAVKPQSELLGFYSGQYTLFFCFGILAYYAWQFFDSRVTMSWRRPLLIAAVVYGGIYVAMSASEQAVDLAAKVPAGAYLPWLMPPGLICLALLMHSAMLRTSQKFFLVLGDASYSLYLTHLIVLQQLAQLGGAFPLLDFKASIVGVLFALVAATVVAVAVFYLIERPLHRLLTMPFRRPANMGDLGGLQHGAVTNPLPHR